jgi:hypothetical protein
MPAACSLSPMETLHTASGRAGLRLWQPRTFAIAIAGCKAGVGQEGCGRFPSLAEIIV